MSHTVDSIFETALKLSDDDRAELADRLFCSVGAPGRAAVDAAWAEEAERRLRQIRGGEVKSVPWEELRDSLLNRVEPFDGAEQTSSLTELSTTFSPTRSKSWR